MGLRSVLYNWSKDVKEFAADLNTTAFGKINTEILWYLTLPFCFLVGRYLSQAEFIIGTWLAALCGKSGFEFVRYRTDRNTEFTPTERANADAIRANAGISVEAPVKSAITTPNPKQDGNP